MPVQGSRDVRVCIDCHRFYFQGSPQPCRHKSSTLAGYLSGSVFTCSAFVATRHAKQIERLGWSVSVDRRSWEVA